MTSFIGDGTIYLDTKKLVNERESSLRISGSLSGQQERGQESAQADGLSHGKAGLSLSLSLRLGNDRSSLNRLIQCREQATHRIRSAESSSEFSVTHQTRQTVSDASTELLSVQPAVRMV